MVEITLVRVSNSFYLLFCCFLVYAKVKSLLTKLKEADIFECKHWLQKYLNQNKGDEKVLPWFQLVDKHWDYFREFWRLV